MTSMLLRSRECACAGCGRRGHDTNTGQPGHCHGRRVMRRAQRCPDCRPSKPSAAVNVAVGMVTAALDKAIRRAQYPRHLTCGRSREGRDAWRFGGFVSSSGDVRGHSCSRSFPALRRLQTLRTATAASLDVPPRLNPRCDGAKAPPLSSNTGPAVQVVPNGGAQ